MFDLLLINAAATWYMTGLIWFVQWVHYPLFGDVEAETFTAYHKRHMDTTGFAVGPAMMVEMVSGLALLWMRSPRLPGWIVWSGFGGIAIIWLSTSLVQVPIHYRLAKGWDGSRGRMLVRTNWLRTIVWSGRAVLMLYAIHRLATS